MEEEQKDLTDPEQEENKEKDQEKNKKSYINSFIFLIVLIGIFASIMFLPKLFGPPSTESIIKDIIDQNETKDGYLYNGFVFIHQDDLWHTQWQKGDTMLNLHFHYGPRDVEKIPMIGSLDKNAKINEFYVTFGPNETNMSLIAVASSELGLNLVNGMNIKLTAACTYNDSACAGRPIITCNNTNKSVIYIKTNDVTNVLLEKNCITIQGEGEDLIRSVDKFLFSSYQIIPRK